MSGHSVRSYLASIKDCQIIARSIPAFWINRLREVRVGARSHNAAPGALTLQMPFP